MNVWMLFLAIVPTMALSLTFHRIAAKNGRDYGWFGSAVPGSQPFVDERLNQAYATLKRFSMVGCLSLIVIAVVGGLALSSETLYYGTLMVAILVGQVRALYKEGALAFGAELREPEVKPVVPEFRPAGSP